MRKWLKEQCVKFKISEKLPKVPTVDKEELKNMGIMKPDFIDKIRNLNDLYKITRKERGGIAHFLLDADGTHVYTSHGESLIDYSVISTALLRYVSQAIDDLRAFYAKHLNHYLMRGSIAPVPENRDEFIVREPK